MEVITLDLIRTSLYRPPKNSHKGQNGRLTIVGGSKLFHGASLWALKTASRIVDMVYYASVEENLGLIKNLKKDLYDFIAVPRGKEADYIAESDVVLLGPGLVRGTAEYTGTGETGEETKKLVLGLIQRFPQKRWVLDAGALQVIRAQDLKKLPNVVVTPHRQEFAIFFEEKIGKEGLSEICRQVQKQAQAYGCVIVLKGKTDIVCSADKCWLNETGNEGMTKGGTGDVLAGLIAALACKNDLFLAAAAGVYLNGKAGDELYQKVGPYFNASDLCEQVPKTMAQILGY